MKIYGHYICDSCGKTHDFVEWDIDSNGEEEVKDNCPRCRGRLVVATECAECGESISVESAIEDGENLYCDCCRAVCDACFEAFKPDALKRINPPIMMRCEAKNRIFTKVCTECHNEIFENYAEENNA